MVAALQALKPKRFILDGELAIPVGKVLSFDALQLRLHPAASRVNKLAAETPSILIAFDLLQSTRGVDSARSTACASAAGSSKPSSRRWARHRRCASRRRPAAAPKPNAG